jgi:1-acyl-sn-glycerol-3-phosphate acyltransferase
MFIQISLIAIAALLTVTVAVLIYRAARCDAGWRAWICYQVAMIYNFVLPRCTSTNECTFPEYGPAIIVANHTSPADPVLLWMRHFSQFKKPRLRVIGYMMAKEYYTRGGLLTWICKAMECIPVERNGQDMAPIKEALRRLQAGHLLGLFPEGGINIESPNEQLRAGGVGVAWLALRSKAPVIPVFISDAPRSESMVRVFFQRTRSRLTYGDPVDLSPWQKDKPSHTDLIEATDKIMQSIASLGGLQITPSLTRATRQAKAGPKQD